MKFKTQTALNLVFLNLKHKGNSKVVEDPASYPENKNSEQGKQ